MAVSFLIHGSTCTMVAAVIVFAQWNFWLHLYQHSVPVFPLLIGSSSSSLFICIRKTSDFPRTRIIIIFGVFIDTLLLYCCLLKYSLFKCYLLGIVIEILTGMCTYKDRLLKGHTDSLCFQRSYEMLLVMAGSHRSTSTSILFERFFF